jgi:hypothetical protein
MYVFLLPLFNKLLFLVCQTLLAATTAVCQSMSAIKSSPYSSTIATATGAAVRDWGMIEAIMRTEIYHSTLDWQSAAELADGARQAYQLLRANRPFYELSRQQNGLFYNEMKVRKQMEKAEAALSRAESRGDEQRAEASRQQMLKATQRLHELNEQMRILSAMLDRLTGYERTASTLNPALSS